MTEREIDPITYYLSTHIVIFALSVPLLPSSDVSWYLLSSSVDIMTIAVIVFILIFSRMRDETLRKTLVALNAISVTVDCITLLLTIVSIFECAIQGKRHQNNELTLGYNICLPVYLLSALAESYVIGILLFSITWLLNMSRQLDVFMVESFLFVCVVLTTYISVLLVYMTSYIVASFEFIALCLCVAMFFTKQYVRNTISGFAVLAKTGAILFLMVDVLRLTDGEELLFETQLTRWLVLCGDVAIIIFIITVITIDVNSQRPGSLDGIQDSNGNNTTANGDSDTPKQQTVGIRVVGQYDISNEIRRRR